VENVQSNLVMLPCGAGNAFFYGGVDNEIMTAIKLSTAFGLFISVGLCQVDPTLTVQGIGGTSITLSASDIAKLPTQTVKVTDQTTPVTFEGLPLTDVLAKVRTPTGEAFNKTVASYYVVAEAHDGYRAVFSWAEIDPTFTDRKIYIVTKRTGSACPIRMVRSS
jgi:hypothetical protein